MRARSSDSYAGLYLSYHASYSSAYISKAFQGFIKVPPYEKYFYLLIFLRVKVPPY
ncbi:MULTISPECIES: hypothetical protein [unclassified Methanosarcina]|uniref:hypothetical protein n=1 Tax=unclassified Methanosarcina TaxID=2644672 RepID=UPI000A44FC90|nr:MULTISPECIES: hypothetical protein [unclassified Methanosarcina]